MGSKESIEIIKSLVGDELFGQLINQIGGQTVYFPYKYEWQDKEVRNLSLREDFYSGNYEISDLARKYDLSISMVYKIIQHRE